MVVGSWLGSNAPTNLQALPDNPPSSQVWTPLRKLLQNALQTTWDKNSFFTIFFNV